MRREHRRDGGLARADPAGEPYQEHGPGRYEIAAYPSAIATPALDLYAAAPAARLAAARALSPRAAAKLRKRIGPWPSASPGACNAWLLLVTTKPPDWRDVLTPFPDDPLALGDPHPGFLYPDPIGFWREVRRWCAVVVATADAALDGPSALAVSAFIHLGDRPEILGAAMAACRPAVVLFLDEPAWATSGWSVRATPHHVPDPHRPGQVYQGFWGRRQDGTVVGKAPQHPSAHRFYDAADMEAFLRGAPVSTGD